MSTYRLAKSPLYMDRKWLYSQYVEQGKSAYQIAEGLGCTDRPIYYWLEKFGISRRSLGDAFHLSKANHVSLSDEALSFIEGELLGDGNLHPTASGKSVLYQHSSKHEGYLAWLSGIFSRWGLQRAGRIHPVSSPKGDGYHYATRAYVELRALYDKWYPHGKKVVPVDLELGPLTARQWYIGDGCLQKEKGHNPWIVFATNGFSEHEASFLSNQLNDRGIKSTVHRTGCGPVIYVSTHSVMDFLEWIGPCPSMVEEYYGYKWSV